MLPPTLRVARCGDCTMSAIRVCFFGNHTVGVATLRTLTECVTVTGVVAHPPDPEDGYRYQSVFDYAQSVGLPAIRGSAKSASVAEFALSSQANLYWVTDYRYLLPDTLLNLSERGAVNLHPSLLPRYRGRASLNWAILRGEQRLGLTAHFISTGIDDGDIIAQRDFHLSEDEDVGDALNKLMPLYRSVTRDVIHAFRSCAPVPRTPQSEIGENIFPARKPADGEISWSAPACEIVNLVRAVARPYPGAFTTLCGVQVMIWKARGIYDYNTSAAPGTVVRLNPHTALVACGSQAVEILEHSQASPFIVGQRLGS